MRSKYTLWKKYLLFTILKRTIQKSEHVEEVAAIRGKAKEEIL